MPGRPDPPNLNDKPNLNQNGVNMRHNIVRGASIAFVSSCLCTGPVFAGSGSAQFNAGATVLSACSIVATDLVFGNYSASAASPTDVNNSLSMTCTSGIPYNVALDGGLTAGNVAARTMTDGSAHNLAYLLYTGSNHSTLWGDGTGGTSTVAGTGTGAVQSLSVFGRIPTAQFVTAGSYADKVTVTINY